jgi:DNA-directed RNA polymerase specialized sigma24 family protein
VHHELAALYVNYHRALHAFLRRRFPALDDEVLRDAVQEAFLDVCREPRALARAHRDGGRASYKLLCCMAWRKARGEVRRKSSRVEATGWEGDIVCPPGQLFGHALGQLARLVSEAVCLHGHSQDPQLRLALEHKLWSGEPDRQVAAQFGVPREYLNKAKRFIQDGLLQWC